MKVKVKVKVIMKVKQLLEIEILNKEMVQQEVMEIHNKVKVKVKVKQSYFTTIAFVSICSGLFATIVRYYLWLMNCA